MDIFEGRGYDGVGNFSMMANGMGNIGNFGNISMGNMARMANGMGNFGNFGVNNPISKSNCSSESIFVSPDFREAAEKLRDQVRISFCLEDISWRIWNKNNYSKLEMVDDMDMETKVDHDMKI